MNNIRAFLVMAAGLLLVNSRAMAVTVFFADLTNSQEVPPVIPTTATGAARPASFGSAIFTLDDAMTQLSFTATIFNIDVNGNQTPNDANDNLTNAHIHAGPLVAPGVNGPVVWGFFGAPFNNIAPNDGVFTAFTTGVGGTFSGTWNLTEGNATTLTAQLPNILAGRSYINFHTVQFGGGEIRGAIVPAPDGGITAILFGLTCLGLVRLRRMLQAVG